MTDWLDLSVGMRFVHCGDELEVTRIDRLIDPSGMPRRIIHYKAAGLSLSRRIRGKWIGPERFELPDHAEVANGVVRIAA